MTAPQPAAPAEAQRPVGVDTLTPPDPAGPAPDPHTRPPVRPPSRAATVRALVSAVAGSVLAGYAAVVALVSLLSTTANADWSLVTTLRSAAPLWLAVHQVPLTITLPGGAPATLGVLPLLPTLGLAVLVARAAAGVTARLDWHTPAELATLAVAFAGGTAVLGVAIALAEPTSSMTAAPVAAAAGCAATAGLSALWGGLRAVGFSRVALTLVPPWAVRGVLAGLTGLVALLAAGALFTFGGLALSAGTAREVLGTWSAAPGGRFGVTVLSIAYLPNAIIGATSWTMGPGLSVGAVSVTLFGTSSGALPPVPLLAALPEPGPAPWRVLVFVLPLLAGLLVARRCRRLGGAAADHAADRPDHSGRTDRLHAVVTAGIVAAAGCFVLAVVAGGRLGGGAFDPVRIPSASLALAAFVWIVLPAGVVIGLRDRSTWRLPDPHLYPDDPDHLYVGDLHPDDDPDHIGDPDARHLYVDAADPDADADPDDADTDDAADLDADDLADADDIGWDDVVDDHAGPDAAGHLGDGDGVRVRFGAADHTHPGYIDPDDFDAETDMADELDAGAWHTGDHVDETVVWYAAGHDDEPDTWDDAPLADAPLARGPRTRRGHGRRPGQDGEPGGADRLRAAQDGELEGIDRLYPAQDGELEGIDRLHAAMDDQDDPAGEDDLAADDWHDDWHEEPGAGTDEPGALRTGLLARLRVRLGGHRHRPDPDRAR